MKLVGNGRRIALNPGIMAWLDRVSTAGRIGDFGSVVMAAGDLAFHNQADMFGLATLCANHRLDVG